MYKTNLDLTKFGYLSWRYPHNIIHNIGQFFRNLRFMWQRAKRGFADCDFWSLCDFYTSLFISSLEYFKEHHHGIPGQYCNDKLPDNGNGLYEYEIEQIIRLFEKSCEDNEDYMNEIEAAGYDIETIKKVEAKRALVFNEAWRRLGKIYDTLWD